MAAYDAFLVELFKYTKIDTLKAISYEDLSRATNKVCLKIYTSKPTEQQKKERANIKRRVKMEWKKENEVEEGVVKTNMIGEREAPPPSDETVEEPKQKEAEQEPEQEAQTKAFEEHEEQMAADDAAFKQDMSLITLAVANEELRSRLTKLTGLLDGLIFGSSLAFASVLVVLIFYKLL